MSERVAVVAVHGVAHHEPGASANAVSELLLGLPEDGRAKYGAFAAETIHIPLHPLNILRPIQAPRGGFLSERTVYLTSSWQSSYGANKLAGEKSDEIAANDFMRLLLQEYRGSNRENKPKDERDDTAYRTTRLAGIGTRKDESGAVQEAGVHVYEMYWADLARPKKTLVSFSWASINCCST